MESLRLAGERLGITTEALLRDTARLALGTTVGTNAMLQRRGAKVGLITTRGHRDVIHIMRGARGVPGLNNVQVLHFPESGKPDPIVPKPFIAEVSERVDCKGQVVVELNEEEAEAAIRKLVGQGRGVDRHLLSVVVQVRRARAAGEGHGRAAGAQRLRLLLGGPDPALGRVRAHGGHGAQRLPGAGDVALPRPARVARAGGRPALSAAGHAVRGRRHPGRRVRAARLPHARFRPGGRRARLAVSGRPHRSQARDRHRHGRHLVRRRPGVGRRAGGELPERGPPVRVLRAAHRHPLDRQRRRLDRVDRRGERHHAGGPDLGRRPARARLLRPRRHAAHGDRRRPGARLSRPRHVPRRPAASRRGQGPPELRAHRHAPGPGPGRDRRGRRARGRAPDGRPDPQGDRAEGLRSARLRGLRLRRRRSGARRRLRARAGRPERGGAARRSLLAVVRARRRLGGPPAHLRGGRHPVEPVRPRARDAALRRARGAGPRPVERRRHRTRRWPAGALGGHPLQGPDQRGRGAGPIWNARRGRAGPARRRLPPPVRDGVRPGRRLSRGARGGRHLPRARLGGQRQAAHRGGRRRRPRARRGRRAPARGRCTGRSWATSRRRRSSGASASSPAT